jgi:hypothetical protein
MVIIKGLGWITQERYGCLNRKINKELDGRKTLHALLRQEGILAYPVNNFGRFDWDSKITCALVGLALFDAGLTYKEGRKNTRIGLIGTNADGSLESNLKYFRDYIDGGRKLARGNLFIYTLPSSPLAEASIHFGLQGPIFYSAYPHDSLGSLFKTAEGLILRRQAQTMLITARLSDQEGFCAILSSDSRLKDAKNYRNQELFLKELSKIPLKI